MRISIFQLVVFVVTFSTALVGFQAYDRLSDSGDPATNAADVPTKSTLTLREPATTPSFELNAAAGNVARVQTPEKAYFGLELSEEERQLKVLSVDPSSCCNAYGIQAGDVIVEIAGAHVFRIADFDRTTGSLLPGESISVTLARDDKKVVIGEMRLGRRGEPVFAPSTYAPLIERFPHEPPTTLATQANAEPSETHEEEVEPSTVAADAHLPKDRGKNNFPIPIRDSQTNAGDGNGIPVEYRNYSSRGPKPNQPTEPPALVGPQELDDEPVAPSTTADNALSYPDVPIFPQLDANPMETDAVAETEPSEPEQLNDVQDSVTQENKSVAGKSDMATTMNPLPSLNDPQDFPGFPTTTKSISTNSDADNSHTQSKNVPPSNEFAASVPPDAQGLDLVGQQLSAQPQVPVTNVWKSYGEPNATPTTTYDTAAYGNSPAIGVAPAPVTESVAGPSVYQGIPGPSMVPCECGDIGSCSCGLPAMYSLESLVYGNREPRISFGGWFSTGYHSKGNDLFNSRPDEVALHQAWFFVEKSATHDAPIGFRADVMYGIDGADTQAFGNDRGTWDFDNGFDHGAYAWALPQLYGEVLIGDWRVKIGHFFTIMGYETVTAPDNFFYSHAMTMYNSEPFTHTGVLSTYAVADEIDVYAGWTLGWDTGFDQVNSGNSWLGGFTYKLSQDIAVSLISTVGNFGARGDDGIAHSAVLDVSLTEKLTWVVQSDVLRVESTGEDNVGVNQYLLYDVTDRWGIGARMEWWKGDVVTGYAPHGGVLPTDGSLSYYAATLGLNCRPNSNVTLRPEFRVDWSPSAAYEESYFGMDAIVRF